MSCSASTPGPHAYDRALMNALAPDDPDSPEPTRERRRRRTRSAARADSGVTSVLRHLKIRPSALWFAKSGAAADRALDAAVNAGFNVREARSAALALQRLRDESILVLITDHQELAELARAQRPELSVLLIGNASEDLRMFVSLLRAIRRIANLEAKVEKALDQCRMLSTVDQLTRVANRRFFDRQFQREIDRAVRTRRPLSLIMCDVDRFKDINDRFGHPAGDQVLRAFATSLSSIMRKGQDWIARVGGEEFAIVLSETGPAEAAQVAERARLGVRSIQLQCLPPASRLTASFGVCGLDVVPKGAPDIQIRMLRAADTALYRSKHRGRDCVSSARDRPERAPAEGGR